MGGLSSLSASGGAAGGGTATGGTAGGATQNFNFGGNPNVQTAFQVLGASPWTLGIVAAAVVLGISLWRRR